jgi:uncharacterized protein (TIGR00295 family)
MLRDSGCDEDVIRHCEAVSHLAIRIAKRCTADVMVVEAGSLLHDIGRSKTHGISHAVEGAKIAQGLGLPTQVIRIIERHIGGGIPRDDAKGLGLPDKDYIPETLEEAIVAHADNLFEGTKRITIEESVASFVRTGLHGPAMRVLDMHKRLSDVCGMDIDEIR